MIGHGSTKLAVDEPSASGDSRAWLVWVMAAAAAAMLTRNPLYILIILLAARLVTVTHGLPGQGLPLSLWRLGGLILTFSAFFNALFLHVGQTVLLRLPAAWPLIGGAITLEAVVAGASNGLVLLTLLAVFVALNAIVPVHELVRLLPRALRDLGVVILIAITYVPATMQHVQRIREAQAIRGHQLRGLRDWRPIVIPLLVGGLERAMGLAEAMVARGYGATDSNRQQTGVRAGFLLGLATMLAGWFLAIWIGWPGWLLLAAAGLLLWALVWRLGVHYPRTQYHSRQWQPRDGLLLAAGLLPLLAVLAPLPGRASLVYEPFPQLALPAFSPVMGLLLACLALPAFVLSPSQHDGYNIYR